MAKRAFTLIELLVVIAIIAILAAILFPVFAQAKMSAKVTASVSNLKQHITAAMVYSGDHDDRAMLSQSYQVGGTAPTPESRLVDGKYITIWTTLIQPYMRSKDLYTDPAGPRWRVRTEAQWTPEQSQAMMPGYGYNSATFSPLPVGNNQAYAPIYMTEVADPARTIFFVQSMVQYVDTRYGFYWVFGSSTPVGWISWGNVDHPACGNPMTAWCGGGWGNNYNWTTLIEAQPDIRNGNRSGGVAFRHAGHGIYAHADGHVKRYPIQAAAAGTNWTPDTSNFQVVVQDRSRYLWDKE
jgi:prepilin-type N-terminal cleavage/methylation domain-containing protein/prepilin-type processing-associated H-X9-DG protein